MRQSGLIAGALALAIFALVGAVPAQEPITSLEVLNRTDASIRIKMFEGAGAATFVAQTVPPRQTRIIPVTPGRHIVDFIAFKVSPPHSHRVGIDFFAGQKTRFDLTPHRMGFYLLEDSDSLYALGTLPSVEPMDEQHAGKHPDTMLAPNDAACRPPINDWEGVVLWTSVDQVQYYRRRGNILCGADGEDLFREDGLLYSHYICSAGWTRCVRHQNGDFRASPAVRTSEIVDIPLKLARADDPKASYTRTRAIIAQADPRRTGNMTTYLSFISSQQENPCPAGYRLHYQGFCIKIADELADDPKAGVRTRPLDE